jgi:hypothetical protein
MPRIKTNVRDALNSPETHKAIAVLAHVHAAMRLVRQLSPPTLEGLRDEFEHMANKRTGPRGELPASRKTSPLSSTSERNIANRWTAHYRVVRGAYHFRHGVVQRIPSFVARRRRDAGRRPNLTLF